VFVRIDRVTDNTIHRPEPDLRERWPPRLVATAEEDRLSLSRGAQAPTGRFRQSGR
jgi:hypothetical protein